MRARVQIVTPMYNAEAFVAETIAAVRAQTESDWRYVIVDDGSTDRSVVVAEAAAAGDPRIEVVRGERMGRPAPHRNAGARMHESEFLWFVDADDLPQPALLARAFATLDATGADVFHCGARHLTESGLIDAPPNYSGPVVCASPTMVGYLANYARLYTSSVVIRRAAFESVGGFSEASHHRLGDDTNLWWRLGRVCTFAYAPERLLHYRIHASSLSSPRSVDAASYRGRIATIEESTRLDPHLGIAVDRARRGQLANRLCRLAETLVETGGATREVAAIYGRVRGMRQRMLTRSLLIAPIVSSGQSAIATIVARAMTWIRRIARQS
jgi:glycosyltransferase involved in cell wall biosynthesis